MGNRGSKEGALFEQNTVLWVVYLEEKPIGFFYTALWTGIFVMKLCTCVKTTSKCRCRKNFNLSLCQMV